MSSQAITFIKGDEQGSETDYRDALPENMYAVEKPLFGAQGYMVQEPGITQFGEGSGVSRGANWNERFINHYRVSGTDLIEVDETGAVTVLGEITGTDIASMPYSFNTQGVVADGKFWLYDSGSGFREVTDPDLGDPIDCVWVDGYYFFTDGESLYHTLISDEEAIEPLDFAVAEFMPDKSLGLGRTSDNKVIVFGRYTCEYLVNVGNENFAFTRIPTRAVKAGIVATHAKCELSDVWYMMGGRKEESIGIHRLGVGSVERVSTREVEKIIKQYSEEDLVESVLESREEDGSSFVIVHLPNETLKFNETIARKFGIMNAWSILKTGTGSDTWRAIHGIFDSRLGQWVYGDKTDGRMGLIDETVSTQYGDISEWVLYSPYTPLERVSVDKFEIETVPGFTGEEDATVFFSITYNGVTYGLEWIELYGAPNDYEKRFIIRRLGYVRDWAGFKLRAASRSRMAFSRAYIDYS